MHVKKDDTVIVITGADKGKTGKILKAFPVKNQVVVEGINMRKRHRRANREGQKGQIIDLAHPINVSNVRKANDDAPKKPRAKAKKEAAK